MCERTMITGETHNSSKHRESVLAELLNPKPDVYIMLPPQGSGSQRQGGGEIVRASEEEGGTEDVSGHPREAESVYSQQLWLLHKFKPDSLLEQRGRDS